MSVLRFVARSMLASYFVLNGVRALAHPEDLAPATAPIAEKLMPKLSAALPESARAFVPTDATGLVKLNGLLQIVGGASLATGFFRRIGAGVLAVTTVPNLLAANPLTKGPGQAAAQAEFGTNVALLGGVLLAAQDTEGKPTLVWRLRTQRELLAKDAAKRKAELERDARATAADAAKLARKSVKQGRKFVAEVLS
ncbi:MAG TPA: DoxX family protein [Propionicimonas sp.]|nr:DoxX family protein [Propionicimonas sp.]HQA77953.1 DoxX family protein [Propionicimonas sp.]HQD96868.1 DoxX family protein [Propionicimonas sp.]